MVVLYLVSFSENGEVDDSNENEANIDEEAVRR